MNKEELIKMIELLPIEELNGFKIYYYNEKEKSSYGYSQQDKRHEHSISYGLDYDQLHLQRHDKLVEQIKCLENQLYEMRNSNEYNK